MACSRTQRVLQLTGLLTALAFPVGAQEPTSSDPTTALNYINAWQHGIGDYGTDQQSIRVLSIPVSITLRSLRSHPIGVNLRLTGMVAGYAFATPEEGELSVTGVALMPGLEFLIPIGPGRTLRPSVGFGAGTDLDSNRTVWMTAVSLRSEFVFPWKRFYFGVTPGVEFSASGPHVDREDDRFLGVLLRADVRHPFWFAIDAYQPDIGPYVEYGYYIDALDFTSIVGESLEQKQRWEVGVSVGFRGERPKLWIIRVPRVSVGWRFGNGVNGIRIRIGGDWVSPSLAKAVQTPQR